MLALQAGTNGDDQFPVSLDTNTSLYRAHGPEFHEVRIAQRMEGNLCRPEKIYIAPTEWKDLPLDAFAEKWVERIFFDSEHHPFQNEISHIEINYDTGDIHKGRHKGR